METPITNEFELFEELRKLVQRAERGGLISQHIQALRSMGEQVMATIVASNQRESREVQYEDRRDSFRFKPQEAAVAVVELERIPVNILDLGGRGVGVFSPQSIATGSYLLLEIMGPEGLDIYSCFTAFCREKEDGYRIGLRLFAKLPR